MVIRYLLLLALGHVLFFVNNYFKLKYILNEGTGGYSMLFLEYPKCSTCQKAKKMAG